RPADVAAEAARCDRCARAAARRGIRRPCHCEEQSDEAISIGRCSGGTRLLRCARNDSLDVEARGFLEMARVHFSGEAARRFTGGLTEIEVQANNFRRMVLELDRRFPGLGRQIEESMAVAIDGEIFQDAYLAPLGPDSEIYLIPKIGGG